MRPFAGAIGAHAVNLRPGKRLVARNQADAASITLVRQYRTERTVGRHHGASAVDPLPLAGCVALRA
jgi:hypothetical protein